MTTKLQDPLLLPYRRCVGIVVFNAEGKVWAGRRKMQTNDGSIETAKLWQFPQGGIDANEAPLEAAKRELYEETGMRSVRYLDESKEWINYDLPEELIGVALKGKYRGQTQKWFALRFEGDEAEIAINPPPDKNTAEFDQWQWVDIESMPMMVVSFKQAVYERVIAQFRHIIMD